LLLDLYTVFIVQAYQTSQYVVPRGGIFLGKWRSSFAGSSDGKMNAQSACALNTQYKQYILEMQLCRFLFESPLCFHAKSRHVRTHRPPEHM
jgi:hypothetical protein